MQATRDGDTFTIRGQYWSGTYPMAELPAQLSFYRRLKRNNPKSGDRYDETIAALEGLSA